MSSKFCRNQELVLPDWVYLKHQLATVRHRILPTSSHGMGFRVSGLGLRVPKLKL